MTKELFIETISALQKQQEHDSKCYEAFKILLPNDFVSGYDNHNLTNQLIKILQVSFNDEHEHSWIEYFCYDLNFGKKYHPGSVTDADGSHIDLSDAGNLYDFLIEKK